MEKASYRKTYCFLADKGEFRRTPTNYHRDVETKKKPRFQLKINDFRPKTRLFHNEAEGARTLNLRIDSPML
jgi:hypothetical protein